MPTERARMQVVASLGRDGLHSSAADYIDASPHDDDPLLACLGFIARRFGLPFSGLAAIGHLPIGAAGRLTLELFPRAAARVGLKARLVKRRPSRVPGLLVPYIVLFANGDAAVVVRRGRGRRFQLVFPAVSDGEKSASARTLDREALQFVIYVAKDEVISAAAEHPQARPGSDHWFWSEVARCWPAWTPIILAALVVNVLGLVFPLFVMNIYDRVIPSLAFPTLWSLAAGVLAALLFEFLLRQLRAMALEEAGRRIDMKVASKLFEHILAVAMKERRLHTGSMANQVREFETVREVFTSSSIIAVTDFLFIGFFILLLLAIVGPIAYLPMAAVPLVLILTCLIQIPLERSVRLTQREASRRHSILLESLADIETVKAIGAEGVMQRRWEDAVASTARAGSATRFWPSVALHLTAAVQQGVGILVVIWGVFLVADGKITVGGLIAASLLSGRVLAPLTNIALTLARLQQALTAMRAITALMKLDTERGLVARAETVGRGSVEFRRVHFAYPEAVTEALSDVTFRIVAGERVGIVGRIGSGKTTVGRLIAGLYPVDKGALLISGAEIRRYDPAELRRGIGFVSQDAELFTGTLRENIVMGNPTASEAEIAEAAAVSGVEAFVGGHPLGLALPVGERGRGLSGGQRQAVALARMLLRRPKVLFLDEPSGAMDANTESELIRRLKAWSGPDLTLLICSHRLSFLELVDRVLVFEAGRLVADGPKAEVLARLSVTSSRNRGGVEAT